MTYNAAWARLIALLDDCSAAAENEAGEAVGLVLDELVKTPPSTCSGMRAVLQHLVELDSDGSGDVVGDKYLPTLLRSPVLAG